MQFSKCDIEIDNDRVKINFKKGRKTDQVVFERSFYREYAYFKKKSEQEINRWFLGGVLLIVLIGWITLSEYYGERVPFKTYDNMVMPFLIILFFMTLFFDVLGDVQVVRFLIKKLFFWKKKYIVIILKSGVEHEIPVRSESEAIEIGELLKR